VLHETAGGEIVDMTPLVSIVVPVYNAAATVTQAIGSLLQQTYRHFEIIVVDDGSTDESSTVVRRIQDSRLRFFQRDHQGVVGALRFGCAQARGAYIARLDADDATHERRVGAQVEYLEGRPEIGLLGTWAVFETEDGMVENFTPPTSDAALRRYLLWDSPFVQSSVMFRTAVYQQAGGYAEKLHEDYWLWIRMARLCKLAVLPEVFVRHRLRRASLSGRLPRHSALGERLRCQWEAARTLGPWYAGLPALALSASAYVLALLGGEVEAAIRRRLGNRTRRLRGFRDEGSTQDGMSIRPRSFPDDDGQPGGSTKEAESTPPAGPR
jgi:hypothetical protein